MDTTSPKLSLKDTVYQQMVELICQGKITPDTLFTENQMIAYFKVSKSPIREALIQLCHENVLKSIPRCGYQVIQISQKNIRDVTELRLYLELSSLSKVMDNLTLDNLEELKRQNHARVSRPGEKDVWIAWQNNYHFHMTVVRIAGNEQVNNAMEQAMTTCRRAYAQLFTIKKEIIASNKPLYHDCIVQCLEKRDIFSAHDYLKKDILFMQDELLGTDVVSRLAD